MSDLNRLYDLYNIKRKDYEILKSLDYRLSHVGGVLEPHREDMGDTRDVELESLSLLDWAATVFSLPEYHDQEEREQEMIDLGFITVDGDSRDSTIVPYEKLEIAVEALRKQYLDDYNARTVTEHTGGDTSGVKSYAEVRIPLEGRDDFVMSKYKVGTPMAQKIFVPSGSKVLFFGDIHGSAHELMRNIIRLGVLGHLDRDFKVTDGSYLVFTGDFVDRGLYGIEVWYTLMRLKLANPDSVFLLAGNHEANDVNISSFVKQVEQRYGTARTNIEGERTTVIGHRLYSLLPYVLYVASGDSDNYDSFSVVQACHGGVDPNYHPEHLLRAPGDAIANIANTPTFGCLNWSDFTLKDGKIRSQHRTWKAPETTVNDVEEYLKEHNIKMIIRGHQDHGYSTKLFPSNDDYSAFEESLVDAGATRGNKVSLMKTLNTISHDLSMYKHMLPNTIRTADSWRNIHNDSMDYGRSTIKKFLIAGLWYFKDVLHNDTSAIKEGVYANTIRPVVTGTTASASRVMTGGGAFMLTTAVNFSEWIALMMDFVELEGWSAVKWVDDSNKKIGNYCRIVVDPPRLYFGYSAEKPDNLVEKLAEPLEDAMPVYTELQHKDHKMVADVSDDDVETNDDDEEDTTSGSAAGHGEGALAGGRRNGGLRVNELFELNTLYRK